MTAASFHNPTAADEWFSVEVGIQAEIRDAELALRDLEPGQVAATVLLSLSGGDEIYRQTVDGVHAHLAALLSLLDRHYEVAKRFRK